MRKRGVRDGGGWGMRKDVGRRWQGKRDEGRMKQGRNEGSGGIK